MRLATLFILAALAQPLPALAQHCRQALALALDVSGSVDMREYRMQLDGLATALEDPEVAEVLLATPGVPVWLAVFEWSGRDSQRLILDWRPLNSADALGQSVAALRGWRRQRSTAFTGLGAAMEFGAALLGAAPLCGQYTLDISGDGMNNEWPRPRVVKNSGVLNGLTINGLVIGDDMNLPEGVRPGKTEELTTYFQQVIIQGPDAFVEVAFGYGDYAEAMKRKLLREIATLAVGALTR